MEARDRVSCDSELLDTLDQWTLQTFKGGKCSSFMYTLWLLLLLVTC